MDLARLALSLLVCLGALPAARAQSADTRTESADTYRLRAGDVVRITVFNEPDLTVEGKLDPDGVVIVPLLGRTTLAGLTAREAEARLEHLFITEDYLIHPQVTVTVVQYAQQVFYIFGEVRSPGAKVFPPGRQSLDILEAITLAGDLTQYAKRNEVILRRPVRGTGTEERIVIDLERLIRGGRGAGGASVEVLPEDILFIPQRMF